MRQIMFAILGWFVGSGIAANVIIIERIIQETIKKKRGKNEKSK